jgi:ribosomal-protein-alanine N-acetyltransferase
VGSDVSIRIIAPADAAPLAEVLRANREFLAPWEPIRDDAYFTVDYHRASIVDLLIRYDADAVVPLVILDQGRLVGRININNIVRGAFHSGDLGYWVSQSHNGRGVASAAVAATVDFAFGPRNLHRLQAGVLRHNQRSQRVLEHNGFETIGVAAEYLNIGGEWQDHLLFQRINESWI